MFYKCRQEEIFVNKSVYFQEIKFVNFLYFEEVNFLFGFKVVVFLQRVIDRSMSKMINMIGGFKVVLKFF